MDEAELDALIRAKAFEFLTEQTQLHGEILSWQDLLRGFEFQGKRVGLIGYTGIFKPATIPRMPLSLITAPPGADQSRPYADEADADGFIRYRYRGTNPDHPDNVRLRMACNQRVPMVYLYGVSEARYRPVWPIYIVADNRDEKYVTLAADIAGTQLIQGYEGFSEIVPRRRYVTAQVRRRLHQQVFREQVVQAYRVQCAICSLKHIELLEASHIIPDRDPDGAPLISNGIALCNIHHAAYDRNILGIRPDFVVDVRKDILEEVDGPMLKHGLQGFQGAKINLPRKDSHRPSQTALDQRYQSFLSAAA
jgi:putative restriction endonuclease